MVDVETLGLEPGCVVLSIGAVEFDTDGIGDTFYCEIDRESARAVGLEEDEGTLDWWENRDEDVQDVLTGGDALAEVLVSFRRWYNAHSFDEVWANSPSFDCEVLEAAFDAVGLDAPWTHKDERDVRTIRNLPCSVSVEMEGDAHDALDDARWQAREVGQTYALLPED